MTPIVFALPENEAMARSLAVQLGAVEGRSEIRRFPDGDTYIRVDTPVDNKEIILVCSLDRPDRKFLPLAFMAENLRDLGAARVGLVCPYLSYMRQDKRFQPGEAVSSIYFAKLLSAAMDWLVTVDPHLHRRHALNEIFSIPSIAAHAAPYLAAWIKENVKAPVLIGPDSESEQWVESVAAAAGAPYLVLEKIRTGDRNVAVSAPDLAEFAGRIPVLVDDIISTARTMSAAIAHMTTAGHKPVCVGVHAIFAGDAFTALQASGAGQIVTCNTVPHESNRIDLVLPVAAAVRTILRGA